MEEDLLKILCFCLLLPSNKGQQVPIFLFPMNMERTVNGSSETGHCTNTANNVCYDPTSSVLFDGIIPTLTGLDGNMWASQLLTIQSNFNLSFNFATISTFVGVKRVEIVLFNCPEWEISVQNITLWTNAAIVGTISPAVTSCNFLVRVCIPNLNTNSAQRILTLTFTHINPSDWVNIAEVEFYGAGPNCPPDSTANTAIAVDFTTTANPASTTSSLPASTESSVPASTMSYATEISVTTTPTAPMDSSNVGAIAGGVIIAITAITAVVIIIICFIRPKGKEAFTNFVRLLCIKKTKTMEAHVYDEIDVRCKPPKCPEHQSKLPQQQAVKVVDKPKHHKPSQQPVKQEVTPPPQPVYVVVDKSKRNKPEEYTTVQFNTPEYEMII